MSKLSKPLAFSVMPRPLPRPALAVATALVGLALTGTPVLALVGDPPLELEMETYVTWGELHTIAGWVAAIALCLVARSGATSSLVAFWQASPRQASPLALACVLLVVLIVTATVALVAFASPILIGSAGSLADAISQSIRSE